MASLMSFRTETPKRWRVVAARLAQLRRRAWARWGTAGVVGGLALLSGSGALGVLVVAHQAAAMDAPILAAQAGAVAVAAPASDSATARASAHFLASLPPRSLTQEHLMNLADIAERHGLMFARGDYQATVNRDIGFVREELTLPILGDARAIEAFVSEALAREPALAIEKLHAERATPPASGVDVRIRLSLFVADDGAAQRSVSEPRTIPSASAFPSSGATSREEAR